MRIDGFEGKQYLAVEGSKIRFKPFQLVLLLPRFIHDLLQDGDFLFNVGIVPCVFLYQTRDAVEGIDEVPAGGLRVGSQPPLL